MTIFEKIAARQIPAAIVYETSEVVVFRDIKPQAPTHLLVVPKRCVPRLAEAAPEDTDLLGKLLLAAAEAARREGLAGGYRVVINNGPDAGETVPHLHLHLLAGRSLNWPPG
jgi:histidine triad (HIT) family protein